MVQSQTTSQTTRDLAKPSSIPLVSSTPSVEKDQAPAKKGWGALPVKKLLPDMNAILEEKAEKEEDELVQGSDFLVVSQSDFLEKWHAFADRLKRENKITLFTIMTANAPRLLDTIIEVDVENMVQQDALKLGKIDMLNFLRVELRNYALDIKAVMIENTKIRKPYTSQEKYQAMSDKNPALEMLRKAFDLGLS